MWGEGGRAACCWKTHQEEQLEKICLNSLASQGRHPEYSLYWFPADPSEAKKKFSVF